MLARLKDMKNQPCREDVRGKRIHMSDQLRFNCHNIIDSCANDQKRSNKVASKISFDTAEKEPRQVSCKIRDREPFFGMVSALDLKIARALGKAITALVFIL